MDAISIRKDGKAEFAFTGNRNLIWHRLGQGMKEDASIEEWRVDSGMDWTIQRSKVRYAIDRAGTMAEMPEQHVLLRSDTKAPLAVVSQHYKPVQPGEVLEFFSDLIRTAGFKMSTAGVLFGGKRFWAAADMKHEGAVVPHDMVKGFLTLATSADGSMKTICKNVVERPVCHNTLSVALGESGKQVAVSHRSYFDEAAVKRQLGLAIGSFDAWLVKAREAAKFDISPIEANAMTLELMGGHANPQSQGQHAMNDKVQSSRGFNMVMQLFNGAGKGADMPGVKGTQWGWLNAVTEYVDHHQRTRSDDNKFDSALFGAGDAFKQKAWAMVE